MTQRIPPPIDQRHPLAETGNPPDQAAPPSPELSLSTAMPVRGSVRHR